jgi:hypothetical protein
MKNIADKTKLNVYSNLIHVRKGKKSLSPRDFSGTKEDKVLMEGTLRRQSLHPFRQLVLSASGSEPRASENFYELVYCILTKSTLRCYKKKALVDSFTIDADTTCVTVADTADAPESLPVFVLSSRGRGRGDLCLGALDENARAGWAAALSFALAWHAPHSACSPGENESSACLPGESESALSVDVFISQTNDKLSALCLPSMRTDDINFGKNLSRRLRCISYLTECGCLHGCQFIWISFYSEDELRETVLASSEKLLRAGRVTAEEYAVLIGSYAHFQAACLDPAPAPDPAPLSLPAELASEPGDER